MHSSVKIVAQYAIKNADKMLGSLKNGLQVKKKKKFKMTKHWENSGIKLCISWSKDFSKSITRV